MIPKYPERDASGKYGESLFSKGINSPALNAESPEGKFTHTTLKIFPPGKIFDIWLAMEQRCV
jgi:hypothetical protein